MNVTLKHDSIILESESPQDWVFLEHFMGKELDVTYGKIQKTSLGDDGKPSYQFRMNITINGAEITESD